MSMGSFKLLINIVSLASTKLIEPRSPNLRSQDIIVHDGYITKYMTITVVLTAYIKDPTYENNNCLPDYPRQTSSQPSSLAASISSKEMYGNPKITVQSDKVNELIGPLVVNDFFDTAREQKGECILENTAASTAKMNELTATKVNAGILSKPTITQNDKLELNSQNTLSAHAPTKPIITITDIVTEMITKVPTVTAKSVKNNQLCITAARTATAQKTPELTLLDSSNSTNKQSVSTKQPLAGIKGELTASVKQLNTNVNTTIDTITPATNATTTASIAATPVLPKQDIADKKTTAKPIMDILKPILLTASTPFVGASTPKNISGNQEGSTKNTFVNAKPTLQNTATNTLTTHNSMHRPNACDDNAKNTAKIMLVEKENAPSFVYEKPTNTDNFSFSKPTATNEPAKQIVSTKRHNAESEKVIKSLNNTAVIGCNSAFVKPNITPVLTPVKPIATYKVRPVSSIVAKKPMLNIASVSPTATIKPALTRTPTATQKTTVDNKAPGISCISTIATPISKPEIPNCTPVLNTAKPIVPNTKVAVIPSVPKQCESVKSTHPTIFNSKTNIATPVFYPKTTLLTSSNTVGVDSECKNENNFATNTPKQESGSTKNTGSANISKTIVTATVTKKNLSVSGINSIKPITPIKNDSFDLVGSPENDYKKPTNSSTSGCAKPNISTTFPPKVPVPTKPLGNSKPQIEIGNSKQENKLPSLNIPCPPVDIVKPIVSIAQSKPKCTFTVTAACTKTTSKDTCTTINAAPDQVDLNNVNGTKTTTNSCTNTKPSSNRKELEVNMQNEKKNQDTLKIVLISSKSRSIIDMMTLSINYLIKGLEEIKAYSSRVLKDRIQGVFGENETEKCNKQEFIKIPTQSREAKLSFAVTQGDNDATKKACSLSQNALKDTKQTDKKADTTMDQVPEAGAEYFNDLNFFRSLHHENPDNPSLLAEHKVNSVFITYTAQNSPMAKGLNNTQQAENSSISETKSKSCDSFDNRNANPAGSSNFDSASPTVNYKKAPLREKGF